MDELGNDKNEVIGTTLAYSSSKAKERNKNLTEIQEKINKLEILLDKCQDMQQMAQLYDELVNTKHDLDIIMTDKTAKIISNTKVKWYNEGEASTKYFFTLEKQRALSKSMSKVFLDDGTITTERGKILQEQKKFYQELYQSDSKVEFTLTNPNLDNVLSNEERNDLDEPVTLDDLTYSLKNMASGKTPGTDGLTPDFYKCFWNKLSGPLLCAFNYAKKEGCLHSSARRGILSLIPKKEKNEMYIKNWRPITLLNTDYKILSKAIANRIQKVLPKLISIDQTGFMRDRNIATNIRKIIDIDQYCQQQNIDAMILSIDFHKCFDSVETSQLHKVMRYFNFGPNIITWVQVLFKEMLVCTLNYGYTSDHFQVSRGLLQGNPIASYAYLLVAQVLHDRLIKNDKIQGITIGHRQVKAIQFADDLNIPLLFHQESLNEVLRELSLFKQQIGLDINVEKSCIYRIGGIAGSMVILNSHGIPWINQNLNVLGINVTSQDNIVSTNMDPLISKMQARLDVWRSRDLSLIGKVLILNSLIMSIFVYRMSVLPSLSKGIVQQINKIWSHFLWSGKKPKIAWNILCSPKNHGGLGLSHLIKRDQSLKIQWVAIYMRDSVIASLADYFLNNKIGSLLWECNFNVADCHLLCKAKGFWMDVLKSWSLFNYINPNGVDEICDQVIWYNSHIKMAGSFFCDRDMINNGIIQIKDLLNMDDNFMSINQFKNRFPNLNFMRYVSLLHAIPTQWKKALFNRVQLATYRPPRFMNVVKGEPLVRISYKALHTHLFLPDQKRNKWERILRIEIWPDEFSKNVKKLWLTTNYSKLRSFQYKLFMHAIVTNVQLKLWNIIESEMCTFCKVQPEDIVHLFCECTYVKNLISQVKEWCDMIDPTVVFSNQNILFNTVHSNPRHVINTIILIMKYYIYSSRCLQKSLSISHLKETILYHNKMEYLGAIVNNKRDKCTQKWEHAITVIKY